jgi:hypothetical protein
VAQLDDVYSDLRLNYETLKGLISLASLSVAKPTHFAEKLQGRKGLSVAAAGVFQQHLPFMNQWGLNVITSSWSVACAQRALAIGDMLGAD